MASTQCEATCTGRQQPGDFRSACGDTAAQGWTEGGQLQLDGVVIETTGLADPAPVAQTFFMDRSVKSRFVLDGVITLGYSSLDGVRAANE